MTYVVFGVVYMLFVVCAVNAMAVNCVEKLVQK